MDTLAGLDIKRHEGPKTIITRQEYKDSINRCMRLANDLLVPILNEDLARAASLLYLSMINTFAIIDQDIDGAKICGSLHAAILMGSNYHSTLWIEQKC